MVGPLLELCKEINLCWRFSPVPFQYLNVIFVSSLRHFSPAWNHFGSDHSSGLRRAVLSKALGKTDVG